LFRPDIQIVSKHHIKPHGTTQIRCIQPAEALKAAGYSVSVSTINRTLPTAKQFIVMHRVQLDDYTRHFIICAQARGIPLIYDTDDLLFDPDGIDYLSQGSKAKNYISGWKPYADAMAMCDAVTVSTDFLATRAQIINPNTHVILNALSDDYLRLADEVAEQRNKAKSDHITMAYLSGSNSHDADFASIEDTLVQTLHKYPKTRLFLVGPLEVSEKFATFGDRIIRNDFVPYSEFPTLFRTIDINLIPLETDQAFCHAKSELKFIEAAACGIVSIASPTEPHKAAITHGKNGLLATDDWEACLSDLISDKALRKTLGQTARKFVHREYGPATCQENWEQNLSNVKKNYTRKSVKTPDYLSSMLMTIIRYSKRKLFLILKSVIPQSKR